jgi:hypothetical protein
MQLRLLVNISIVYLLGLLLSCLNTRLFCSRKAALEFYKTSNFWFAPLALIIFGLVIGLLLSMLIKPKEKIKFLFYSALTGCLLFCIIIVSFRFDDWYHSRYLANIEFNEEFINSNSSYPVQEKQAFKMLTDKYEKPNNLILTSKSISKYDSIVNKVNIKAYDIEFVYLKKNVKGHFKSKCTIIGNKGNFQYFDRLLNDSEEHSVDSSNNEGLREGLETILDDSERLSLDSTSKATIRNKIKSKKIALDTLSNIR